MKLDWNELKPNITSKMKKEARDTFNVSMHHVYRVIHGKSSIEDQIAFYKFFKQKIESLKIQIQSL